MSVPAEKKVPLFERFLEKNPFIKTIELNRRKQLMKAFKTKKNTNDFGSHLSKLYSHFQIQSKSNEPIIQESRGSDFFESNRGEKASGGDNWCIFNFLLKKQIGKIILKKNK